MPTIGVSIAIPSPHAEMLQAQAGLLRRPAGRLHPHPRDPAAADRGGGRRARSIVVEHLAAVAEQRHPVPDGAARHGHLPAHLAGRLRPGLRRARRLRAAREGGAPRAAQAQARLLLPPARHGRPPRVRGQPRPGLQRAGRLRVHLRRDRVPPLRARHRRRLAPGALVRAGRGADVQTPQGLVGPAPDDPGLAGLEALRRPPRQPARGRGRLLRLLLRLPRGAAGLHRLRHRPAQPARSCSTTPRTPSTTCCPASSRPTTQPDGIIDVNAPTGATLSISGVVAVVGLVLAGHRLAAARCATASGDLRRRGRRPATPCSPSCATSGSSSSWASASCCRPASAPSPGRPRTWAADLVGLGGQAWVLTRRRLRRRGRPRRRPRGGHAADPVRRPAARGGPCATARSSAGSG